MRGQKLRFEDRDSVHLLLETLILASITGGFGSLPILLYVANQDELRSGEHIMLVTGTISFGIVHLILAILTYRRLMQYVRFCQRILRENRQLTALKDQATRIIMERVPAQHADEGEDDETVYH